MLFGAAPPRPPSAPSLGHLREIIRPLTPHVFYNRMCTALAEQERAKEALKEQSNEEQKAAGTFPTLSKKSRGKRGIGDERSGSWQGKPPGRYRDSWFAYLHMRGTSLAKPPPTFIHPTAHTYIHAYIHTSRSRIGHSLQGSCVYRLRALRFCSVAKSL